MNVRPKRMRFIWSAVPLLCIFYGTAVQAAAETMRWAMGPPLTLVRSSACAVTVKDHLYIIGGGWSDPFTPLTSVEHAVFQPDGRLSPWRLTSRMTTPRVFLSCVEFKGYLYAIGGERFKGMQPILLKSVERATILSDGSLGQWEPVASLDTPRRSPVALVAGNAIYVIGGYNGTFLQTVERARLLPDGKLGPWKVMKSETVIPRYIHTGVQIQDRFYLLGGHDETAGMANNRTEWTRILPDGDLAPWQEGPLLLSPRFLSAALVIRKHIYLFGGSTGRQTLQTLEVIGLKPDGSLGASKAAGLLRDPRSGVAVAKHGRFVYVIGGVYQGQALAKVEYTTLGP